MLNYPVQQGSGERQTVTAYYSEQQLPASQHAAGGIYSLSSVTANHTGVCTCRAEREDPVTETQNNCLQHAG